MKFYKSFVFRLIIFFVIFASIDFACGYVFRYSQHKAFSRSPHSMHPEFVIWGVNADVIVIGASDAMHSYVSPMIEDSLGLSTYNCGIDGIDFVYQNALVNSILNRYAPKLIVWSIVPNLLSPPPAQSYIDRLSELNPFYDDNVYCRNAVKTKSKYEWLKNKSNMYKFNSQLLNYIVRTFSTEAKDSLDGYSPLYNKKSYLIEAKKRIYENDIDLDRSLAFEKTLNRCKSLATNVVLVLTPRFENAEYNHTQQYIALKDIINKNNYSLIEDLFDHFLYGKELFRDCGHLNDKGAHKFTELLTIDLRQILAQHP